MEYSVDRPDSGNGYFSDDPFKRTSDYEAAAGNPESDCE